MQIVWMNLVGSGSFGFGNAVNFGRFYDDLHEFYSKDYDREV